MIPSGPNKEPERDQPVEEEEQDEQGKCKPDEKEVEEEEVPPTGEHTPQAATPGHPTSKVPAEPPQSQTSGQETPAEGKAMETEEAAPREEGKDNKTSTGTDDRSEREKERDRRWLGRNKPLPGSYAYVHGRHGLTSDGLNHPGPDGTQHYCWKAYLLVNKPSQRFLDQYDASPGANRISLPVSTDIKHWCTACQDPRHKFHLKVSKEEAARGRFTRSCRHCTTCRDLDSPMEQAFRRVRALSCRSCPPCLKEVEDYPEQSVRFHSEGQPTMEEAIMKTLEGQPIGPAAEPAPPPAAGHNGPGEGAPNSAHYHGARFLPPLAQTAGPPYHYCFAAGEPTTNKTPKGELSGQKAGPVPGCAACRRKGPICQQCIACSPQTTTVWSILEREEETDQTEACALQEDSEVPGRGREIKKKKVQGGGASGGGAVIRGGFLSLFFSFFSCQIIF